VKAIEMSKRGEPRSKLTNLQRENMIRDYYDGVKYKNLAVKYSVSDSAISSIIYRAKLPFNRLVVAENDIRYAEDFCEKQRKLSIVVSVIEDPSFIRNGKSKNVDERAFDTITPEAAYWLGLLMSDGSVLHIPSPNIVLQLTTPDEYQIEAFKSFLKSKHKVSYLPQKITSQGLTQRPRARISIVSKRLGYVLSKFGIIPNKSKNACAAHIHNHPDFWRGMIDGDGHIGENSFTLIGTKAIIYQFNDFCKNLCPQIHIRLFERGNIWGANINGKSASIILYSLYHDKTPCLARKSRAATALYCKHIYSTDKNYSMT
jgi:hypothetical protein